MKSKLDELLDKEREYRKKIWFDSFKDYLEDFLKGYEQGKNEMKVEVIKRMAKMKKFSIDEIADASNLPNSKVKKIIESMEEEDF